MVVLGVEHRLAEVGDDAHQRPADSAAAAGGPGRSCARAPVGAASVGAAGRGRLERRLEVDVEGDGRPDDRLAARQPAQADQGALAGGDRAGGGREQVGEAELAPLLGDRRRAGRGRVATSNSGVSPLRLSAGRPRQGEVARR